MLKAELRKIFLAKQKSISKDERLRNSLSICDLFFGNFQIDSFSAIHIFISIEENMEVETRHIYERIWKSAPIIRTLAPRVDFETELIESFEFSENSVLPTNKWDIREPIAGEPIDPSGIDLVFVPLLCFDQAGFRVGYGKGFYDKFLKTCRPDCLKIGLSHLLPVIQISDLNENDVRLNYCLTPDKLYKF